MATATQPSTHPLPADIDDAVLASDFESRTLERARAYQRQGRASVFNDSVQGAARTFSARVRGTHWAPYLLKVEISREDDGEISIFGTCSCPMQLNCKHVAAAVLQWRREAVAVPQGRPAAPADPRPATPSGPAGPSLSRPLAEWIEQLGGDLQRSDEASDQVRKRLVYVLTPQPAGGLAVDVVSRELDREGRPKGAPKAYDANNALGRNPAKFLRTSDLDILPRLIRADAGGFGGRGPYYLAGRDGTNLLAEILETGRARWHGADGVQLRAGDPRAGSGVWQIGADGAQRFTFVVDEAAQEAVAVALSPLHYVDPKTGETGVLRTGLPDTLACRLLAAPAVPPDEAAAAAEALARILPPEAAAPLPQAIAPVVESQPKPIPVARLTMKEMPLWRFEARLYQSWQPAARASVPALDIAFDYDGTSFAPNDARPHSSHYDGECVRRIQRNPAAEASHLKQLFSLGFAGFPTDWSYGRPSERPAAVWLSEAISPEPYVRFLLDLKPELEAQGWRIDVDPEFPLRLAAADQDRLELDLHEVSPNSSGIDWFDLALGVTIGGERLDLLPVLAELLARLPGGRELQALAELAEGADGTRSRLLVTLPDGRILPLALAQVAPILEALLAVWGPAELAAGLRLHPAQAADVADLEARLGGYATVMGGERLKLLAEELASFRDRPSAAIPSWFQGRLRPYQQVGVDWLQMLARAGFGGVLADDMGLGKTVQLLAHLAIEKQAGRLDMPALVVAPTSVLGNWRSEAARFAPELRTLVHQGLERARTRIETDGVDLVLTSYPLLARDRELLLDRRWSLAVLDEAQTIRNPKAATSLAAFALQARQRLALSGTPVENHLGDIWSLMNFLNPGLLGDAKSFRAVYRTPIEKKDDAAARARLSRRLKPFLLRRTKAEVASDLPPKTDIRESVTLTPAQHQLYEATRLIMQKKVRDALDQRGLAKSAIIVLDALLKLRQACCDPRLVKSATEKARAGGSAKLDRLMELIAELKEEGRSALVFSQFTSMLDLIRADLDGRGWRHAWLTGDTTDRATPVAAFQAGEVDLFLISLKAGGVGLNLTRADTVILYDPWWNPAVEAQAIDRAHRIGQSQPVFVHRLIAEATIEEKMLELQARKKVFADALWDGEAGGFSGLTEADVRALFD